MSTVAEILSLSATPVSTSAIQLAWALGYVDDPADPDSVNLTLTDTAGHQYFNVAELTTTAFLATGLAPGRTYVFTLLLKYSDGFTSQATKSATTFPVVTPPPTTPPRTTPPPHTTPPPTTPPPTPPPGSRPLGECNGLSAIGYSSQIGEVVLHFAVGFGVDAHQQINRIVRTPYPAGASQSGLEPWTAAGKLPGTYIFMTTPACAISATPSTAGGMSSVLVSEISSALGADTACYAIINGLVGLGGKFVSGPVMTSWPNGRIDVFALDSNDHLQQATMTDGNFHWLPWHDLGVFDIDQLSSAISCDGNLIDVAGKDNSRGALKLFSWNGSSWGTFDLSFDSPADAALASSAPGRLDVLALGNDRNLYHRWRIGTTWSGWEVVGATGGNWAKPAVASWGPNRLDVVVVGSDCSFYHKYYDGSSWHPAGATTWNPVGGELNSPVAPVLAAPAVNWIEVFVKGTDSQWYTNTYNGSGWEGWIGHGVFLK
jgi:hypothetical protein